MGAWNIKLAKIALEGLVLRHPILAVHPLETRIQMCDIQM
jgi:hypothetical protein